MRGLVLILSVALAAGCDSSCNPTDAPPTTNVSLGTYLDQNLRNLGNGPKEKLNSLIKAKLPDKYHERQETFFRGYEPWHVWRNIFSEDQKGFILLQARPIRMVPDDSEVTVHFFNESERLISSIDIATGWRMSPTSANLHFEPAINGQVIEVESAPTINGRDVRRQIYSPIDGRIALVRLEDSDGKVVSNFYHAPNHTIGPDVPKRTADEWEAALNAPRPTEVLEALIWLGGTHRDPATDEKQVSQEDLESASLAAEVRKRLGVRNLVRAMSENRQGWVREAAELALKEIEK
jgi:hypothetical protein